MKKAVIYARYSCDKQSEQSIEGQLRVCESFAEREGYEVINTYIDRAKSATTANRPKFLSMVEDAAKREFDTIIVYKLDRFSRNRYDSAIYKNKLAQYGVRVVSATENLSDNPEGIITEAMLIAMAEFYSAELGQKTRRGMHESALKCQSTGALPPYGYFWGDDKKLQIDEKHSDVPKIAFQMYADGKGKKEIALELNNKGYRTRRGSLWTHKHFDNMLRNKKYIGVFTYNKGEIEIEGGCPALIERELFEKVQNQLEKTRKAPAKAKAKIEYLLSGKLFCGECGAKMIGESGTSQNGNIYHYYKCSKRKNDKTCNKLAERQEYIEWYIAEQTIELLNIEEQKDRLADKVIEAYTKAFGISGHANLEKRLKLIQSDIKKVVNMLIEKESKALHSRLDELEQQESDIEEELIGARLAVKHIPSRSDILEWFEKMKSLDITNPKISKHVIDIFVNSVFLKDNSMVIVYNLSNTEEIVTFEDIRDYERCKDDDLTCSDNSDSGSPSWT